MTLLQITFISCTVLGLSSLFVAILDLVWAAPHCHKRPSSRRRFEFDDHGTRVVRRGMHWIIVGLLFLAAANLLAWFTDHIP